MVGVILESGRLPGATALRADCTSPYALPRPGSAAKSSISLFRMSPHSPTAASEPKEVLIVSVLTT